MLLNSLKIWSVVRKRFGWHSGSLLAPLGENHSFALSCRSNVFFFFCLLWHRKGILSSDIFLLIVYSHHLTNYKLNSICHTHFFRYLQLRHFVKQNTTFFPRIPGSSPIESIFLPNPLAKGGISTIYNKPSCLDHTTSLDYLKTIWADNLGVAITEDLWKEAQMLVHSSSICARYEC